VYEPAGSGADGRSIATSNRRRRVSSKEKRAELVASLAERGFSDPSQPRVYVVGGPWTHAYMDRMEGFPDGADNDDMDATSAAFRWLEAHPPLLAAPPEAPRVVDPTEFMREFQPADAGGLVVGSRERASLWDDEDTIGWGQ